ncbi:hypothetical protein JYT84_00600, partial [bacterium AH-315-M10]|nr:hypothetical protein [bacterium AH-315-M10]
SEWTDDMGAAVQSLESTDLSGGKQKFKIKFYNKRVAQNKLLKIAGALSDGERQQILAEQAREKGTR